MNKRIFIGILTFVTVVLFYRWVYAEHGVWDLKRDRQGIKVYARRMNNSSINEVKGVTSVHASLEAVISLFENEEKYVNWCYKCKDAELVELMGAGDRIIYFRIGLLWPFSDRDSFSLHKKEVDPQTGAVSYMISDISEKYSKHKGCVRMRDLYGLWRFTPLQNGKVELYYQQYADAGGRIPGWVTNRFSVDSPFYTLRNFRELIMESFE